MTSPSPEAGCTVKPVLSAKPKVISVDGVVISRAAIARETQNHPAAKPIEAWLAAARALVIRELLLAQARRLGLTPSPLSDDEGRRETDEEALIRQVVEDEVRTPEPDLDTCRRYFDRNPGRFKSPTLHEVSHILLGVGRDDPDGARAREKADALLDALANDPQAFPLLATLHSACPSKEVGGNLGQIGPGQTVPEFEAALADAPVGAVAPSPIRTRYGWHVVRVDRRIDGAALPFEAVRASIAAFLDDRVRRTAERQYVQILAGRAQIEGVTLDAVGGSLVQ